MKEKTKMICIKVSPKEIEGIHKRMELAGVRNMSAYLLKMALNGYIINLDLPEINEILRLLKNALKPSLPNRSAQVLLPRLF